MHAQRREESAQVLSADPFVDAATSVDPQNRVNTFLSYYTWGAAVGLGLDLTLRTRFELRALDRRAGDEGVDIAQLVKDLDLEDRAWEVIKNAADPIQSIYDQKMAIENEARLKLEMLWDDYYSCPKCRVEFGADDLECRVCGTARPEKPGQPDPRRTTR